MWHRRRRRRSQHRAGADRGTQAAGIPRLRFGRHRRAGRRGHLQRLRTVGKVRALEQALVQIRSSVASASPTRAGRRTGCRASATPIRMCRATGWRSSTTASSRTTRSCARSSSAAGYQFSSETDTEVVAHRVHFHHAEARRSVQGGARHGRGAGRRLRAGGRQRSRSRAHRSSRAWAVRWCWAWATARISSPRMSRRCCR